MNNNEKELLIIPEFKLEKLLSEYEGEPNNLEWPDIPPVGREIL